MPDAPVLPALRRADDPCSGFLDAYTFVSRGDVFANAQTGNVILGAIDVSTGAWHEALRHLWPILAFVAGVAAAARLRHSSDPRLATVSALATLACGVVVLGVAAAVPTSAPATLVIVPITVVSAMQLELFRTVGELSYAPIATTGNLMRLIETGQAHLLARDDASRRACRFYAGLFAVFATGAVAGAVATDHLGAAPA